MGSMNKGKTNHYHVFVNDELDEEIKTILREFDLTRSELMRTALTSLTSMTDSEIKVALDDNLKHERYGR